MLRFGDIDIEQKPRKRVKLDIMALDEYNEFGGEVLENTEEPTLETFQQSEENHEHDCVDVEKEIKVYSEIFSELKKNPRAYRKIKQENEPLKKEEAKKEEKNNANETKVKIEAKNEVKTEVKIESEVKVEDSQNKKKKDKTNKNAENKEKPKPAVSSNWKQFLASETKEIKKKESTNYSFVGIDCEFVKSDETECLARASLVNEKGEQIYDSYVKPNKKVTDFVTHVSGITFAHIKNAPPQEKVIAEMKKLMLNKIIVGHTTLKDLEVCGLKNWNGFKSIIDIADAQVYSPGGKRVALKKLALIHLGKTIQEGWHSSVEDANIAMQLFLKNKDSILKEKKIIKS